MKDRAASVRIVLGRYHVEVAADRIYTLAHKTMSQYENTTNKIY